MGRSYHSKPSECTVGNCCSGRVRPAPSPAPAARSCLPSELLSTTPTPAGLKMGCGSGRPGNSANSDVPRQSCVESIVGFLCCSLLQVSFSELGYCFSESGSSCLCFPQKWGDRTKHPILVPCTCRTDFFFVELEFQSTEHIFSLDGALFKKSRLTKETKLGLLYSTNCT
ncbi:hypothetical protein N658DRAFT_228017 [Parathielavia hyrcaniae]|uniref:Uncharacterized protein n=1 Tax=Parathielavia hyrcaniae TaxID=113614 RepID=A0AAN6PUL2_9PEZI|nr:hypothetical protein N658DRAFT_228017 [Parathielavia hyrcaniae]